MSATDGMRRRAPRVPRRYLGAWAATALLLTCWGVASGPGAAHAAPADLDPAFGVGGKVSTGFGGTGDSAYDLVLQPDGKLVAAGSAQIAGVANFAVARYNVNGSLDATFGTDGRVITAFPSNATAYALVVQPDGKLVAAGYSGVKFALARYNSNGTLDGAFGIGGGVITVFDDPALALALVVQPDGKLVAAGLSAGNFALARYNANGTLDLTFGGGTGKVTTDFGSSGDWAYALVVQPDGKLVAAGPAGDNFALARYNVDGSLDLTFGGGSGKVATDFGGGIDGALALILQPDGKLVAAGQSGSNVALARYNSNGSLDSAFGAGGRVITDFGGSNDSALALVLQPDGKLVAAGRSGTDFALARYNSDGSPDDTFGGDGRTITDFGGPDDLIAALIVQPDGKLVAAGVSSANFALARYQGGGTAATRMLTITKTGVDSDHRTFRTTDPINVGADYYDPNEACRGVDPATVKFFVFSPEGQLVLGKNRDAASAPTNTVTNSQVGTSKHQALLATLAPGELPAGSYNVVFRVEDCSGTFVLVSELYSIEIFVP